MKKRYQAIIIGAGPAGIGVATELKNAGVTDILIVEREQVAGGIPRHCHHPTFGIQTFKKPMYGEHYVSKILARLGDIAIRTGVDVLAIRPNGEIQITSDRGLETLYGERVILATGVRETPRHPRLVGGLRPAGVMTTGALQQFVYLTQRRPCEHPLVVGSELVSFSALWTLRNAGIKAVAMVEEGQRPVAYRLCAFFATLLGIKIYYRQRVHQILGRDRVEKVELIDDNHRIQQIDCDAVIFTGRFVGEYTLIRASHLTFDPMTGRPETDQFGQCSDPVYFAAGNMLHPVEAGDQCYQEGLATGRAIVEQLRYPPSATENRIPINYTAPIRLVAPSAYCWRADNKPLDLNIRVSHAIKGDIIVKQGDRILYRKYHRSLPERRIMLRGIQPKNNNEPLMVLVK